MLDCLVARVMRIVRGRPRHNAELRAPPDHGKRRSRAALGSVLHQSKRSGSISSTRISLAASGAGALISAETMSVSLRPASPTIGLEDAQRHFSKRRLDDVLQR